MEIIAARTQDLALSYWIVRFYGHETCVRHGVMSDCELFRPPEVCANFALIETRFNPATSCFQLQHHVRYATTAGDWCIVYSKAKSAASSYEREFCRCEKKIFSSFTAPGSWKIFASLATRAVWNTLHHAWSSNRKKQTKRTQFPGARGKNFAAKRHAKPWQMT